MITRVALDGINGYQRILSSRKGWRCASSVADGGTGCSGYVKQAIADMGGDKALNKSADLGDASADAAGCNIIPADCSVPISEFGGCCSGPG
ncbi:MAG: membrane protein insertion efficiency factor YidD [Pseudomonadota bacterium]